MKTYFYFNHYNSIMYMNKDVLITISTPYGDMKAILYDETPLIKKFY